MKNCEITWDLESLYSSNKIWDEDFAKLEALAQKFAAYKGKLAESPAVFKAAIEASDAFDRLSENTQSHCLQAFLILSVLCNSVYFLINNSRKKLFCVNITRGGIISFGGNIRCCRCVSAGIIMSEYLLICVSCILH